MKERRTKSGAEAADGTDDYTVFPAVGKVTVGDKHHAERGCLRPGRVQLVRKRLQRIRSGVDQLLSAELDLYEAARAVFQVHDRVAFEIALVMIMRNPGIV